MLLDVRLREQTDGSIKFTVTEWTEDHRDRNVILDTILSVRDVQYLASLDPEEIAGALGVEMEGF